MFVALPIKRRRWWRWFLLLVVLIASVDYFAFPYGAPASGSSKDRGTNGLWLRYTYYFGEASESPQALARRMRDGHFKYAFFHVRSIEADGSLKYRRPEFQQFLKEFKKVAPEVVAVAWVYAGNEAGRGSVALNRPEVRKKMVEESKWLIDSIGFEGIQWDYEICDDGDGNLLALLDDTRNALPNTFLSVACPTFFPWPLQGVGWSPSYYSQVGKRCDQIALMCYDTGFVIPRAYAWYVRQQAESVPAWTSTPVLVGLPTYSGGGFSHNPRAENLDLGLRAMLLAETKAKGVGLFADYTTDQAEWARYRQLWLQR